MKTLLSCIATHKTPSPPLKLQAVFANRILEQHVNHFSDLDYQYRISKEELTAATLYLLVLNTLLDQWNDCILLLAHPTGQYNSLFAISLAFRYIFNLRSTRRALSGTAHSSEMNGYR